MIADAELPVHQGIPRTLLWCTSPRGGCDGIESSSGVVDNVARVWGNGLRHLGDTTVLEQEDRGGPDYR